MADLTIDLSQALASIDRLERRLTEIERSYAALNASAAKSAGAQRQLFNDGAASALNEVEALNKLQAEYKQTEAAVQTLRRALATAYDPRAINGYTKAIADAEEGMKKLERAGQAVGVNLKQVNREAGTGQQVFENFFGQFTKVSLITAAIAAVGSLVKNGIQLAREYDKATKQFTAFLGSTEKAEATLSRLNRFAAENFLPVENVQKAGKALLAFGENANDLPDVLQRVANISAATGKDFNELAVIYGKARTQGVLFAEDINQLTDAGIPIIQQFAKQLGVSATEVKKLASEGKIGFAQLQLAFFELTKQGSEYAGQAQAGADATDKLQNSFNRITSSIGSALKPAYDSVVESLASILNAADNLVNSNSIRDFVQNSLDFFSELNPIFDLARTKLENLVGVNTRKNKQIVDDDEKALNERRNQAFQEKKLLIEAEEEQKRLAAAAAKNRAKEAEAARKKREAELKEREEYEKRRAELALQNIAPGTEERAIAEENLRFERLKAEFKKYNLATEGIEAQHVQTLLDIKKEFYLKSLEIQRNGEEAGQKVAEAFVKSREAAATRQRDSNISSIEIFEEQSRRFILQLKASGASENEIRFQQTQLDLQAKKARLQNELEFQEALLKLTDAGDAARIEGVKNSITLLKEQLQTIDFQLNNPDGASGKGSFSIWKAFGIDPEGEEGKRAITSLKASADIFKGVLNEITNARKDAADAAVEQADRQVQSAEEALNREIELANAGFASNVELRQQQLDAAKENQKKALEEQRAAARAQLAVDAAQQASNIALSATNLYKTWSTLPFGVGLIAAAAQIASLLGLISSVRARARALSQPLQFRQGGEVGIKNGVFVGPSHEKGGIGVEVEGGEFGTTDGKRLSIVNKRMTAKHFDLLQAINKDDRREIARHALALTPEIEIDRKRMSKRLFYDSGSPAWSSINDSDVSAKLERLIRVQERQLLMMIEQDRRPTKLDDKTVKQGNKTTRYL